MQIYISSLSSCSRNGSIMKCFSFPVVWLIYERQYLCHSSWSSSSFSWPRFLCPLFVGWNPLLLGDRHCLWWDLIYHDVWSVDQVWQPNAETETNVQKNTTSEQMSSRTSVSSQRLLPTSSVQLLLASTLTHRHSAATEPRNRFRSCLPAAS